MKIHIFVNRVKFDESQGVKSVMSVDEIARLVGQTAETAIVREIHGQSNHPGPELSGSMDIKPGMQFSVTRRTVVGGHTALPRVEAEIARLSEGGQEVEYLPGPPSAVIYRNLPVVNHPETENTDVLVILPPGYPAAKLDLAFLPVGSSLIGRVKGAAQGEVVLGGVRWRQISYHPHAGGGNVAWDPSRHGVHTYLGDLLSWLEVR